MEPASEDEREDDAKNGTSIISPRPKMRGAAAIVHSDNVFPVNKPPKRRARATDPKQRSGQSPKMEKHKL